MRHHTPNKIFRSGTWLLRKVAVVAVAVMALAACAPQITGPNTDSDIYPLRVKKSTVSMVVRIPTAGDKIGSTNEARIRAFVRDYRRRALSQMVVTTAPGDNPVASRAQVESVRASLVTAGMQDGDIIVKPGLAEIDRGDVVILSFRGAVVAVPECGDWSGSSAFDPSNSLHTNYGCAYQRNFGLMLADPRDLIRSQPEGDPDPTRRTLVIDAWRTGTETGAAVSGEEDTGLGN